MSFMYVPFWRTGGWDDIQYRTQLYFAPLSEGPVRLGLFLFENGGKAWSNKPIDIEIDQRMDRIFTNADGMLDLNLGPNQIIRVQINVPEHEYGTGELHLLSSSEAQVPVLARGELETFAEEKSGGGFELSMSEITMTGSNPVILKKRNG
jgi:hypothetical protein